MTPQDPKDETREALLKAGLNLFAKHGLGGVTVRDIAQEAGVNVSLVSYHFEGKEGLYRACIEEFAMQRRNEFQGLLRPAQSAEEFKVLFRILVQTFLNKVMECPQGCQIILKEVEAGLPIAADIFEKTLLENFKMIVKFIEDAQEKRFLKRSFQPQLVALMLQGVIFHLQRTEHIGKRFFKSSMSDPKYRQQVIDSISIILLDGLVE